MKTFFRIILIAGLAYFAESLLPWWSVVIVSFLVVLAIPAQSSWNAYFSGFFGVGLLWVTFSWMINNETYAILTTKIAELFHMSNPVVMVFLAGFIGGFVGGFAALSGNYFRKLFEKKSTGYYY